MIWKKESRTIRSNSFHMGRVAHCALLLHGFAPSCRHATTASVPSMTSRISPTVYSEGVRRGAGADRRLQRDGGRHREGGGAGKGDSGRLYPRAVCQSRQSGRPQGDDGPGDLERHRRKGDCGASSGYGGLLLFHAAVYGIKKHG